MLKLYGVTPMTGCAADWAETSVLSFKWDINYVILTSLSQLIKHVILVGVHSKTFYVIYVTFFRIPLNC